MLKTLKKFFDFCGKENRKLFIISIRLGVISAICSAMRIPAAAVVIKALLDNSWHNSRFFDCDYCDKYEIHYAADKSRLPCLRRQAY